MIIKRPIITEKTLTLAGRGWYTFAADIDASKPMIASEVSKIYKVNVQKVRTVTMHGKVRRVGRKAVPTAKPDWKKAMVSLKKGQKIDAFEINAPQGAEAK
jgi:large subunit ribosomal protein L23